MKIVIGSDHAGYELKEYIKNTFGKSISFEDVGATSKESVDYQIMRTLQLNNSL